MTAALSTHLNVFVATHDPRRYLPRAATEAALLRLEQSVLGERAPVTLLAGEPGTGKSLLLRVLAQRVRDRIRTVAIPGVDADAAVLCTMALDLLKLESGTDPEQSLLVHAAQLEARGSALLLAIDDAQRLSLHAAGRLGALAATAGGLRIVAALAEPGDAFVRAIGADTTVTLRTPMERAETHAFVKAALASGWATPEIRALFDVATIGRIHAEAKGVPGEVARLAAEIAESAVRDGYVPEPGRAMWRRTPIPRRDGR